MSKWFSAWSQTALQVDIDIDIVKSGANCESRLFSQFSTTEKFVVNSQTLPFFTLKVAQKLCFVLHGARLFLYCLQQHAAFQLQHRCFAPYRYTPAFFLLPHFHCRYCRLPYCLSVAHWIHTFKVCANVETLRRHSKCSSENGEEWQRSVCVCVH